MMLRRNGKETTHAISKCNGRLGDSSAYLGCDYSRELVIMPLKSRVKDLIQSANHLEEIEILLECYKKLEEIEPKMREKDIEKIKDACRTLILGEPISDEEEPFRQKLNENQGEIYRNQLHFITDALEKAKHDMVKELRKEAETWQV